MFLHWDTQIRIILCEQMVEVFQKEWLLTLSSEECSLFCLPVAVAFVLWPGPSRQLTSDAPLEITSQCRACPCTTHKFWRKATIDWIVLPNTDNYASDMAKWMCYQPWFAQRTGALLLAPYICMANWPVKQNLKSLLTGLWWGINKQYILNTDRTIDTP